jgi:hypothetical protein
MPLFIFLYALCPLKPLTKMTKNEKRIIERKVMKKKGET